MDKSANDEALDSSSLEVDDSSSDQDKYEDPLQMMSLSPVNEPELANTSNVHEIIDAVIPDDDDSGQNTASKTLEDSEYGQGDRHQNISHNKTSDSECGLVLEDQPVKHPAQDDNVSVDETKSDSVAIKESSASMEDQSILKEKSVHDKQDVSSAEVVSSSQVDVKTLPFKEIHPNVAFFKVFDPSGHIKEVKVESDWKPSNTPDPRNEEMYDLLTYVLDARLRALVKSELRKVNYGAVNIRPDEVYFSKLDSSLKKNTTYVRKLKTFTGSQLQSLIKDMSTLNLSKYVSEVAAALVDAKLKMVDVWPAVQLCSLMHQIYADFGTFLLDNWQKVLALKKDDKISNPAKLRVDLRFYSELISVGLFTHKEGLPLLGNILTMLTNMDREEHHNINIILSFCRHCGDDYAGLIPHKYRILSEKYGVAIPRYSLLSKEKQRNVKLLLKDYYNSLCKHRLKEHHELQAFIKQNKKILQTKGELSAERKEKLECLQSSFDRIESGVQQFAEALDEPIPDLPEDETLKHSIQHGSSESEESANITNLWEDEETRRFYEVFPDLQEFIPSLQVRTVEPEPVISEEALDAEFEADVTSPVTDEEIMLHDAEELEESEPPGTSGSKLLMETYLATLPNCVNREMIDSAAIDFVMTLNTKTNRRKLVRALFTVPRIRLDLLPFYGRLVATLHPVAPDISEELCSMLKQDFKYHIRKKDQMNIESKIKVVRFIGELVKFRMYSKIEGLYCLKILVQDFTHHHIEMCCNMLEACGRFFFRHPDCYQRIKVYMDQMMRKKSVMALDSRHVTMIENAYYYVNPPEASQTTRKERPPEYEFIRKILHQDLMKTNTDKILRLMRKLDWRQHDISSYAVKCLTFAFKVKYFNIRCLANLLAGLVTNQDFVGTQVVDGVLEDIRLGMEVNLPKYNQRRVAMIKYLGELYNYRMVESSNIFQVLYSLITFGVSWDFNVPSILDPPDSLFRIRLACVLLETCGQYFISGMSKKKLDVFLIFFQHYFWYKQAHPIWTSEHPFPVGVTHMVKETIVSLRRNIHLYASLEEVEAVVQKLRLEHESGGDPVQKLWQAINTPDSSHQSSDLDTSTNLDKTEQVDTASDQEVSMEEMDIDPTAPHPCDSPLPEDEGYNESGLGMKKYRFPEGRRGSYDDGESDEELSENLPDDGDNKAEKSSTVKTDSDALSSEETEVGLGPKLVECPEDDEFLNAFERMVSDNIQDRLKETIKPQQVDISVPLHIKGNTKKTYEQLQEEHSPKSNVNFVLMLRKGHKQQYKNLAVPINSEMALNLKNREEAERAEKERVKRLTLDINERLEEEDYQEMLAQAQRPIYMNLNRERRHRYQHPKGAPDADLIFGPKKPR